MARHTIGSVSHGTHLASDLIPAFISELDSIKDDKSLSADADPKQYEAIDNLLARIEQNRTKAREDAGDDDEDDDSAYYESEQAQYDLEALFDALNDQALPFFSFGAHEGDGADFGFWFSADAFNEAKEEGEVLALDAGSEWPNELGDCEYVAMINDHGNVTLFTRDHRALFDIV